MLGNDLSTAVEVTYPAFGVAGSFVLPGDGSIVRDFREVTFDRPSSAAWTQDNSSFGENRTQTLQDLASGNAYRLRRLVGKCFVTHAPQGADSSPAIDVVAGFMVCKTTPIGAIQYQYNPMAQDAAEDPWIWRRRWILGLPNPLASGGTPDELVYKNYPGTTAGYGSVQDGPHIDQKTARLISNDEQLWFFMAARAVAPGIPYADSSIVFFDLDLRVLASLRSNIGNKRNASR